MQQIVSMRSKYYSALQSGTVYDLCINILRVIRYLKRQHLELTRIIVNLNKLA